MNNIYDVIKNYNFVNESNSDKYSLKYKNYKLIIILYNHKMYNYEKYKIISNEIVLSNYLMNIQLLEKSINDKELSDINELIIELNQIFKRKNRIKKLNKIIL